MCFVFRHALVFPGVAKEEMHDGESAEALIGKSRQGTAPVHDEDHGAPSKNSGPSRAERIFYFVFVNLCMRLPFLAGAIIMGTSAYSVEWESYWNTNLWVYLSPEYLGIQVDEKNLIADILFDSPRRQPHLFESVEKPSTASSEYSLSQVVWSVPVGCDWSGFFSEGLDFAVGLSRALGPEKFSLNTGHCGSDMLNQMTPEQVKMFLRWQEKSVVAGRGAIPAEREQMGKDASVVIYHKLPGNNYPSYEAMRNTLSRDGGTKTLFIGRQMSESSKIAFSEAAQAERMDEVWVPTEWHRRIFIAGGVSADKVAVIPEAVDTNYFSPLADANVEAAVASARRDKVMRFLSVFKFEKRKGWDVLLRAYWKAFDKDDPVELILRSYKPVWLAGPRDIDAIISEFAHEQLGLDKKNLAPVRWISDDLSRSELRSLYASADAFVLPTRGEGWARPCVEAMAMALPVICTNFSGPTAYMSRDHALPLSVGAMNSDGTAEPDMEELVTLLRKLTVQRSLAGTLGMAARHFVENTYSIDAVAEKVTRRLLQSLARISGRDWTDAGDVNMHQEL